MYLWIISKFPILSRLLKIVEEEKNPKKATWFFNYAFKKSSTVLSHKIRLSKYLQKKIMVSSTVLAFGQSL